MLPSRARARDVSSRLSNQRQWPIPRQTGELGYPYRHGRRRRPIRVRNGGDASWGRSFCSGALFQRDNRRPSTGLLNSAGDWQALDTYTKVTSASTPDPPIRTRVTPSRHHPHTRARVRGEGTRARPRYTRACARANPQRTQCTSAQCSARKTRNARTHSPARVRSPLAANDGMHLHSTLHCAFAMRSHVQPTTLHVPGVFSLVSDAIKHAIEGDTILVQEGSYTDSLAVHKCVSHVSARRTRRGACHASCRGGT